MLVWRAGYPVWNIHMFLGTWERVNIRCKFSMQTLDANFRFKLSSSFPQIQYTRLLELARAARAGGRRGALAEIQHIYVVHHNVYVMTNQVTIMCLSWIGVERDAYRVVGPWRSGPHANDCPIYAVWHIRTFSKCDVLDRHSVRSQQGVIEYQIYVDCILTQSARSRSAKGFCTTFASSSLWPATPVNRFSTYKKNNLCWQDLRSPLAETKVYPHTGDQ